MKIKKIELNQVFQTNDGRLLRVKKIKESGMHTLVTVDEHNEIIPDKKNSYGHIIYRSERLCGAETIKTFKKV